jgi:hypothetical protein
MPSAMSFAEAMSNTQFFANYQPPIFSWEKRLPSPYGVDASGRGERLAAFRGAYWKLQQCAARSELGGDIREMPTQNAQDDGLEPRQSAEDYIKIVEQQLQILLLTHLTDIRQLNPKN